MKKIITCFLALTMLVSISTTKNQAKENPQQDSAMTETENDGFVTGAVTAALIFFMTYYPTIYPQIARWISTYGSHLTFSQIIQTVKKMISEGKFGVSMA